MHKKILYMDESGHRIDVNTIEGIRTIINDILLTCKDENSCVRVKENIKASAEKCCTSRVLRIKTIKREEKKS